MFTSYWVRYRFGFINLSSRKEINYVHRGLSTSSKQEFRASARCLRIKTVRVMPIADEGNVMLINRYPASPIFDLQIIIDARIV